MFLGETLHRRGSEELEAGGGRIVMVPLGTRAQVKGLRRDGLLPVNQKVEPAEVLRVDSVLGDNF